MASSSLPIIRACNLCGQLFPRSEMVFVYPFLTCKDCQQIEDPSEGRQPW